MNGREIKALQEAKQVIEMLVAERDALQAQIDAMKVTVNNLSGIADDQSDEIIALAKLLSKLLENLDAGYVIVPASALHKEIKAMDAKDNA
jgi:chaperonin cofactor prefoldin